MAQRNDQANVIAYFDKTSTRLYAAMVTLYQGKLEFVLQSYADAQGSLAGGFQYHYAEEVAKKMNLFVRSPATSPLVKTAGVQATLAAAVSLNRFAAMDSAAEMIMSVQDDAVVPHLVNMLSQHVSDFVAILGRIDAKRLHAAVRAYYQEARRLSEAK